MTPLREHVISVVLSHDDWCALVEKHPQPVRWLHERIGEELKTTGQPPVRNAEAPRRQ